MKDITTEILKKWQKVYIMGDSCVGACYETCKIVQVFDDYTIICKNYDDEFFRVSLFDYNVVFELEDVQKLQDIYLNKVMSFRKVTRLDNKNKYNVTMYNNPIDTIPKKPEFKTYFKDTRSGKIVGRVERQDDGPFGNDYTTINHDRYKSEEKTPLEKTKYIDNNNKVQKTVNNQPKFPNKSIVPEIKIKKLEEKDNEKKKGKGLITVGSVVTIVNLDSGKEWTVEIVGREYKYVPKFGSGYRSNSLVYNKENVIVSDIENNKISEDTPLAKALIGNFDGREFSYTVAGETTRGKIIKFE